MTLHHRGTVGVTIAGVMAALAFVPAQVAGAAPRPTTQAQAAAVTPAPRKISIPVMASVDDAQQGIGTSSSAVITDKPVLALGDNGVTNSAGHLVSTLVGLRFRAVPIPQGSTIIGAHLQLTAAAASVAPPTATYVVRGQASDNAAAFSTSSHDISDRALTAASVTWPTGAWVLAGNAGPEQSPPDLAAIVKAIVDRPGWRSGNALAFVISGTGRRDAAAFDAGQGAAMLTVQYQQNNTAPMVFAGPDQTIQLPDKALLSARVIDDGLPDPPGVTTVKWSQESGPGKVTFTDSNNAATSASFSEGGKYVLKVTASDSVLSSSDTLTVMAEQAPVVDAGPDQTVQLPATARLDGTIVDDGFPDSTQVEWSMVSGPSGGAVVFSPTDEAKTTATFTKAGTYVLRLTGVNSGHLSDTDDVTVTVTPADLTITMTGRPANLEAGGLVSLHGTVTRTANGAPVGDEKVTVTAYTAPDFNATVVGTVTTSADGTFQISDRPMAITRYVATNNGVSNAVMVMVRPRLNAHLTAIVIHRGQRAQVRGTIAPSADGQPLLLQRWNGVRWVTAAVTSTTGADRASFQMSVRIRQAGHYRFRVMAPAFAGRTQALTPAMKLVVRR